jgi:hypothetical protein
MMFAVDADRRNRGVREDGVYAPILEVSRNGAAQHSPQPDGAAE